ncbi:MAG: PepSY domain-containing protein [Gammaproteobacteria bacterium]|nr:PepSY domain-containing protein [Gammaproteobacteria bacterium]
MKYYLQTALLFIIISSNVWADDHERARELVKRGEIIALEQLLQQVISQHEGKLRLLEAELERKSGRLVYELELVDEQGVVRELYFDAKTGVPLDEEDD